MQNTKSFFPDVPNEDDTTILKNEFKNIDEMPVLLQVWAWDGMTACSAVVPDSFAEDLGEIELLKKLRTAVKIDSGYTFKKSDHYTFVNFGFSH